MSVWVCVWVWVCRHVDKHDLNNKNKYPSVIWCTSVACCVFIYIYLLFKFERPVRECMRMLVRVYPFIKHDLNNKINIKKHLCHLACLCHLLYMFIYLFIIQIGGASACVYVYAWHIIKHDLNNKIDT